MKVVSSLVGGGSGGRYARLARAGVAVLAASALVVGAVMFLTPHPRQAAYADCSNVPPPTPEPGPDTRNNPQRVKADGAKPARSARDERAPADPELRVRVVTEQGTFLVFDAVTRWQLERSGADGPITYLAYWADYADGRMYLFTRPIGSGTDVGHALTNLSRDLSVDAWAIADLDSGLSRAQWSAWLEQEDATPWRVGTYALLERLLVWAEVGTPPDDEEFGAVAGPGSDGMPSEGIPGPGCFAPPVAGSPVDFPDPPPWGIGRQDLPALIGQILNCDGTGDCSGNCCRQGLCCQCPYLCCAGAICCDPSAVVCCGEVCCVNECCNGACCNTFQECCNGVCKPVCCGDHGCPNNYTCCGDGCCPPGEVCGNSATVLCCPEEDPCCGGSDPCCGDPDPCCGDPDPCCGDPDPCCDDPDPCCGSSDPCCGDPDPCCGSSDPCCGSSDPCCGSPDPCCGNPDQCCGNPDPCCGNPDPCCGSSDPCCGNPDPCCDDPDPCCGSSDPCCGVDCDDGDDCTTDSCFDGDCLNDPGGNCCPSTGVTLEATYDAGGSVNLSITAPASPDASFELVVRSPGDNIEDVLSGRLSERGIAFVQLPDTALAKGATIRLRLPRAYVITSADERNLERIQHAGVLAQVNDFTSVIGFRRMPFGVYDALRPGCGPGEWGDWFIPDAVPGIYDFLTICLDHDECYGTCCMAREECDNIMCNQMLIHCHARHDPGSALLEFCRIAAWTYCSAIEDLGAGPYNDAQADCPPPPPPETPAPSPHPCETIASDLFLDCMVGTNGDIETCQTQADNVYSDCCEDIPFCP